ncbi:MAG: hypothetical protein IPJ56_04635 [Gemmatimonadetes bacterium]|nr:hypothetical protein [Gemmatimonadota bacterium]
MGTWVYVREEVIADDPELAEWVAMGLQGCESPLHRPRRRRPAANQPAGRP